MFCRDCGEDNKDYHNYCSRDGASLYKNNKKINLTKTKARFCKECGQDTKSYDIYCTECGTSLFEKKKKESFIEMPDIKEGIRFTESKGAKEALNLKSSLISSVTGFGIIMLLSILASTFMNFVIKDELRQGIGFAMDIKIFKIWDFALLFNATNLKFIISSLGGLGGMSGTSAVAGTPLILLLIPFIIFFFIGIYRGKINNKLGKGFDLKGALVMGLSYGLMLTLIALIGSLKMEVFIPGMDGISLQKRYLIITALINGTLISLISFMIGYAVYWKTSKNNNLVAGFEWLFQGLFMFLIIAVTVNLITGIFIKFIAKASSSNLFANFVMMSQMGIYAFLLANLGSFTLAEDYIADSLSIFKNTDAIKNMFGGKAIFFLYLGILLIIAVFFLYGKKSKEKGSKNILFTTIVYSLVVGVIAYLTYLKLNGYNSGMGYMGMFDELFDMSIGMGFKFIYPLIGSFVLSTCSMFAGYLLASENKSQETSY